MKTTLIVIGALFALLVAIIGGSYVSAYNKGNAFEKEIVYAWEENENVLAQYGLKITELAQITEMQAEDVAAVLTGAIEARYGAQGSQATMQWIQEQNPSLDGAVYKQIMQVIEAGRNDFAVAQKMLVDTKRAYDTALGSFFGGTFLRMAGYPKIDLDDYRIISSTRAQGAFEKGVDEPIQLRKKAE